MANDHSEIFEFPLEILPVNTCLDAGLHVNFIDPLDLVHTRHVQGDNHTFLFIAEEECLSHISAATIRNNDNIVLVR